MSILSWMVVGLIAGWLAGMVMQGGGYGIMGDIIVGISGALVGGFVATSLLSVPGSFVVDGINLTSILVAFLGAVLTIGILRAAIPGTSV